MERKVIVAKYKDDKAALKVLGRNGCVTDSDKNIIMSASAGIGTWGAADYLVKYHGYKLGKRYKK